MMPLMLTTVIAYSIARHFEHDSLYSGWLRRRGESIGHGRDEQVLTALTVREVMQQNPQVVGETASVAELLGRLGAGTQMEFPVVDAGLKLRGVVTMADLARVAHERPGEATELTAADLASSTETVGLRDSTLAAVRAMGLRGTASIPVVEPGTQRLLGVVRHADIMALYEKTLARR
jgi:CIC family chloride channel protein